MKFAKLFERDGEQVLVTKATSEDDKPVLTFSMMFDDVLAVPSYTFPDTEEGVLKRDTAFDICDADAAFHLRTQLALNCTFED